MTLDNGLQDGCRGIAWGKVYPLYGEREYTFPEIAIEIAKVIGKPLGFEQVDAWTLKRMAANSPREILRTGTIWQHFAEIAKDHQNGVFAGTNNLVEKIGGKRPIRLAELLEANRMAFLS
jgi:NAD(P)H dehydrogenase (quinone)